MNLERYEYVISRNFQEYSFESSGPKGIFKKKISFLLINTGGLTYFHLGFGDLDENGDIDDLAVSNNKDTEKILSTVAMAVLELLKHFPDMAVYAEGSTPARTRLYQISIAKYLDTISSLVSIYGLRNDSWEVFEKNVSYDAFLVVRKK